MIIMYLLAIRSSEWLGIFNFQRLRDDMMLLMLSTGTSSIEFYENGAHIGRPVGIVSTKSSITMGKN